MSLIRRTLVSLTCDAACGARLDTDRETHLAARIDAAQKGWRYAEGVWLCDQEQRSGYHKRNGKEQTLRGLDVCPDCEVPQPGSRITRAEMALQASERSNDKTASGGPS